MYSRTSKLNAYTLMIFIQKLSVGEKRGPRASFKLSRKLPFIKKRDIASEEPEEAKRKSLLGSNL